MTYETITTGLCLGTAASIIWNAFTVVHWRKRAERAETDLRESKTWEKIAKQRGDEWRDRYYASEAALAKIEATVSECNEEAIRAIALQAVRDTAPMFRDQAVNTTIAKLKGMETK